MPRKPWIGGNWKCNGTVESIKALCTAFNKAEFDPATIDVIIAPSTIHIGIVSCDLDKRYHTCAQNISSTGLGAFTGELCAEMMKDAGLKWTLVGHSERRQYYGETNVTVGDKTERCIEQGLCVAVCIGETLEEREGGKMMAVLQAQVDAFVGRVKDWSKVVIAYEPVWAIGTGVVATPQQAQEAHAELRKMLTTKVSKEVADNCRIVYGGSVNEKNCAELISQPDIDGFLVGGASLKSSFVDIINSAKPK